MSRFIRGSKNPVPDGLKILSTGQLRDLLQEEDTMDQIVRLSQKFQELQLERDTMLTTNRSLAEESLSLRPRLDNGKLQLAGKYQELELLSASCQEKQERVEAYLEKQSPQEAQNLLQVEMDRAEKESEELLSQFMEHSLPLEAFLESFQSSRKLCHIRRAQTEKLQEVTKRDRNLKKLQSGNLKHQEPVPNGCPAQAPPRVIQLRYGLNPAIFIPSFHLPSTPAPAPSTALPPLGSHPGQPHAAFQPRAPHSGMGLPVGLRVIGQIPGWPPRGVRLQQLQRRHKQYHPEPPYR
ncbi:vacuolar protein sorting-associated protein 37D [Acipenser oxyrinchus oxyrinchus]|uniref:Vacuolar protein sorting-associated protein 37D n=1 Tax=Acipenser oxyrinchus oxyrinchus TaxID=40147 RepID=A0AAD8FYF1_ACIOX|nr:vacuolar protein sorting-associated protein 37D [Acipenser oxyrinchus oxyrinchus]